MPTFFSLPARCLARRACNASVRLHPVRLHLCVPFVDPASSSSVRSRHEATCVDTIDMRVAPSCSPPGFTTAPNLCHDAYSTSSAVRSRTSVQSFVHRGLLAAAASHRRRRVSPLWNVTVCLKSCSLLARCLAGHACNASVSCTRHVFFVCPASLTQHRLLPDAVAIFVANEATIAAVRTCVDIADILVPPSCAPSFMPLSVPVLVSALPPHTQVCDALPTIVLCIRAILSILPHTSCPRPSFLLPLTLTISVFACLWWTYPQAGLHADGRGRAARCGGLVASPPRAWAHTLPASTVRIGRDVCSSARARWH